MTIESGKGETQWLTKEVACAIADPFGEFRYADAQGDVRHVFANAVIEHHERVRAAAPELLEALKELVSSPLRYNSDRIEIDCDSHAEAIERVRKARAAIAKATK
jgi:hypothetical protein